MNAKQRSLLAMTAGLAMAMIAAWTSAAQAETTLITLGTAGGPVPRADRAQSSNLLVVNGTLYLIDAGGGVTGRIVQSGNNFRKVEQDFHHACAQRPHRRSCDLAGVRMGAASRADRHLRQRRRGAGQRRDRLSDAERRDPLGRRQEAADDGDLPRSRRRARCRLPGCEREGHRGREHAFSFSARHAALRQIQVLFLSLRDAGQRSCSSPATPGLPTPWSNWQKAPIST